MWKNIFIESCLLSALIFGGFYIQSNIIKSEIKSSDRVINESLAHKRLMHISGGIYPELIVSNGWALNNVNSDFEMNSISKACKEPEAKLPL